MAQRFSRHPLSAYCPYRELIINLAAEGYHRAATSELAVGYGELEYNHTVSNASARCAICATADVKFIPFADPDCPALRVVRVCQLCQHAQEL